jgi:hypothetical protein
MKRHQHPPQPQLQPEEEQHKNKHKNTKCSLNCINCTSVHLFLCESVTRGCTSQVMMAETTRGATTPWAVGPCYKSESSMVAARALAGFSSSWYRPWLMCALGKRSLISERPLGPPDLSTNEDVPQTACKSGVVWV